MNGVISILALTTLSEKMGFYYLVQLDHIFAPLVTGSQRSSTAPMYICSGRHASRLQSVFVQALLAVNPAFPVPSDINFAQENAT